MGEVSSIFPQWPSISDAIELSSSKWPLNTLSDRLNKKLNTTLSDKQNNIGSMHMFYMLVLWFHITFLLSFSPKFIFISNLPLLVGWHGGKEGNTRESWAAGWRVFHSSGKSGRRQCESKPSKCMLIMSSSMSSTPLSVSQATWLLLPLVKNISDEPAVMDMVQKIGPEKNPEPSVFAVLFIECSPNHRLLSGTSQQGPLPLELWKTLLISISCTPLGWECCDF